MMAFWACAALVTLLTVVLGIYRCEAQKVAFLRRKISAFQGGAIRPAGSPGAQGYATPQNPTVGGGGFPPLLTAGYPRRYKNTWRL